VKNKASFFVTAAIVFALDQLTKYLVISAMALGETRPVIRDFFHLTYVMNKGISFGLLQDFRWVIAGLSCLAIVVMVWLIFRLEGLPFSMHVLLGLVAGGALGNLTDRVRYGEVIDFLDFRGIWPYIFNAADMSVVCGGILLAVFYIGYEVINSKGREKR
jgi:signal peptidase II